MSLEESPGRRGVVGGELLYRGIGGPGFVFYLIFQIRPYTALI